MRFLCRSFSPLPLGAAAGVVRSRVIAASLRFVYIGAAARTGTHAVLVAPHRRQGWDVDWYDPVTLGGVVVVLTLVGFLAAYVASLRAGRVALMICLRDEKVSYYETI
ncbi:MAG: hypothetical protein JO145_11280 [Acidobacteriaceae bacterium]|nr:hypothetical protein [Acidobacteriaceae bacterium]